MTSAIWRVSGEVIEREELLDGRCQVVLDGEADSTGDPDAGGVAFAVSLVWLLGREGEVPLTEGFVTVAGAGASGGELNASLDAGDPTSGAQVTCERRDELPGVVATPRSGGTRPGPRLVRASLRRRCSEGDLGGFQRELNPCAKRDSTSSSASCAHPVERRTG